jgi:hypothetical protein
MAVQPAAWLKAERALRHQGAGALFVALLANACGRVPPPMEPLPEPGSVAFQNSTISPVRVYLVENGVQWGLGYVDGGEQTSLRLPSGVVDRNAPDVFLVAVPVATQNTWGRRESELPDAIRSLGEPTQNLVQMHWVLTDAHLFCIPTLKAPTH